ncbi:MAG: hypothetical protein KGJ78_10160 [Alphaproteobacteria bacterium]|nr:hypothetical protein [Alphaproteobacteria bacterium]
MPVSVKAFFGLCVLLVAWPAYYDIMFIFFPPAHYLADLAKLPSGWAQKTHSVDVLGRLIQMAIWGSILLGIGSLAAFGRRNWARWVLVSALVFSQVFWLGLSLYLHVHYQLRTSFWPDYIHENWSTRGAFIDAAVEFFLIVLVFSPDARPWFRRDTAVT